jgi:hypothetical protein
MKRYKKLLIAAFALIGLMFYSCEPRIEMDMAQWGDHAVITDVQLFYLLEQEHELQEYYENGETTTGIRRKFYSVNSSIDEDAATVNVEVSSETDLTNAGLIIRHEAIKIEPLNEAPTPGFPSDFSDGPYTYLVTSADGTEREWTISFTEP